MVTCRRRWVADKGYDAGDFLLELESREIEPHVAIRDVKRDPDTVSRKQQPAYEARLRMQDRRDSLAYQLSQKTRKKVEECFGWLKTIAGLDRSRHIGRWKIQQQFELGARPSTYCGSGNCPQRVKNTERRRTKSLNKHPPTQTNHNNRKDRNDQKTHEKNEQQRKFNHKTNHFFQQPASSLHSMSQLRTS